MTLSEELEQVADEIMAAEERRSAIYRRSLEAADAEKVCADWMANMILDDRRHEPGVRGWVVDAIIWDAADMLRPSWRTRGATGPVFVSVRPCDERFAGKTYLGVLLGDFPLSMSVDYGPEARVLKISPAMYSPCIYMPDLGEVVFGCGSWWAQIESQDQLRQITTADIESVWYVRALSALASKG